VTARLKSIVPILLSLAAVVAIFFTVNRMMERKRTADEIERLRGELFRTRAAAERCQGSLANSEANLRAFDSMLDSLRARVDSFEAIDGRGVPADRYPEYLETFESYNDSVDVWEDRADRLRAVETSCRATIGRHNALADSLQAVLAAAGIEMGP
jgi:hypothetical protein